MIERRRLTLRAMVVMRALPRLERGTAHRRFHLLRVLSDAGFDIHLVCPLAPRQSRGDIESIYGVCRWLHLFARESGASWRGGRAWLNFGSYLAAAESHLGMAAKVAALAREVDVALCVDPLLDGLVRAGLGQAAATGESDAPRPFYILDLATPLSERLVTHAQARHGPASWAMRVEAAAVRGLEIAGAQAADLTLVESSVHLHTLADHSPKARLWTVADGVDLGAAPRGLEGLPDRLFFCGDVRVPSHARSAVWLARRVMPLIRQARDGATLRIAAAQAPWSVRRLAGLPWVELVSDAPPARTVLECVAGVAPQRDARHAADPVLTAMAAGRPVIATPVVAGALPGDSALGPLPAQEASQFAGAALRVLRDRGLALRHGLRGRGLVEGSATWSVQWRRVGALLTDLAAGKRVDVEPDRPRLTAHAGSNRRPVYVLD